MSSQPEPVGPFFVPPNPTTPKSDVDSGDESAGSLSPGSLANTEVELKAEHDRRIMRRWAFGLIAVFAMVFLCLLPWVMGLVFLATAAHGVSVSAGEFSALISDLPKGAGGVAVLISVLVVSATVPVTLLLALVKLSSQDGKTSGVSSPQWEAISAVVSSLKELLK